MTSVSCAKQLASVPACQCPHQHSQQWPTQAPDTGEEDKTGRYSSWSSMTHGVLNATDAPKFCRIAGFGLRGRIRRSCMSMWFLSSPRLASPYLFVPLLICSVVVVKGDANCSLFHHRHRYSISILTSVEFIPQRTHPSWNSCSCLSSYDVSCHGPSRWLEFTVIGPFGGVRQPISATADAGSRPLEALAMLRRMSASENVVLRPTSAGSSVRALENVEWESSSGGTGGGGASYVGNTLGP